MRIKLSSGEIEIRVQERRVVTAAAFHKGKQVAGAHAVCAPQDGFDLKEGEAIAVSRLAGQLEASQIAEVQQAKERIQAALVANGALRANIILPEPVLAQSIVVQVMKKLDVRRAKQWGQESLKLDVMKRVLTHGLTVGTGLLGAFHTVKDPMKDIFTDSDIMCGEEDTDGYTCTRPKGHPSHHVAHDKADGSDFSRAWKIRG